MSCADNALIGVKLDLNMCRFGQNCDDVPNKRGDQAAGDALQLFDRRLARERGGLSSRSSAAKAGFDGHAI